jgi:hypothetical protein
MMNRIGLMVCAALSFSACAMDNGTTTGTDEQDLGGLTVSVSCDAGGYVIQCYATVSGATAPWTYTWSKGANITSAITIPRFNGGSTATADCVHGAIAGLSVSVHDAVGNTGSASGTATCDALW